MPVQRLERLCPRPGKTPAVTEKGTGLMSPTITIVANAPVSLFATIALILALTQRMWTLAAIACVSMIVSVVLQGRGPAREKNPPKSLRALRDSINRTQ